MNQQPRALSDDAGRLLAAAASAARRYEAGSFTLFLNEKPPVMRFAVEGRSAGAAILSAAALRLRDELDAIKAEQFTVSNDDYRFSILSAPPSGTYVCREMQPAPLVVKPSDSCSDEVLSIDDDPQFRTVLERFLLRQGLVCRAVAGLAEAAALLEGGMRPLAVVLDLHLAESSGLEFVRAFRGVPAYGAVPLIVVSSDTDTEQRVRCLAAGADGFFRKDEDPRLLGAQLEAIVRKRSREANPA